jgi:Tfp pilus assembly protein PilZ
MIKGYSNSLPTLKHFFHPESNNLIINYSSLDDSTVDNFEDFVERCSKLPARRIRLEQRYNIFLNVVQNDKLTHITNFSKRGSFILTTEKSLKVADEASLTIAELSDQTPLKFIIRRKIEWGKKFQPAGIGVEFVSMTNTQRRELDAMLLEFNERMEKILSKWDEFRDDPHQHIFFMYS